MIAGSYSLILVTLSFVISVFGSYTSLRIARQIPAAAAPGDRLLWLSLGAFSMGGGAIWSMHFIGMVAFDLGITVSYDVLITFASLVIAFFATGLGFVVVSGDVGKPIRLAGGGILMGLGIAGMHYVGMAAMRMAATINYTPGLFTASILIAVGASTAALWLAFHLDKTWQTIGGALVMGLAVCGMHYTGMAAAKFTRSGTPMELGSTLISTNAFAYIVFLMSMLILSIALAFEIGQRELRQLDQQSQIGY